MKASLLIAPLLLIGCVEEAEPCRFDRCVPLRDFALTESGFDVGDDTSTWFMELTERSADEPLFLRLECVTGTTLDECLKSFTMPDLPRLPTGSASLSYGEETVGATSGSFRLTEATPATDNSSYRVTGRVDSLGFVFANEEIEVREGTFDVLSP